MNERVSTVVVVPVVVPVVADTSLLTSITYTLAFFTPFHFSSISPSSLSVVALTFMGLKTKETLFKVKGVTFRVKKRAFRCKRSQ